MQKHYYDGVELWPSVRRDLKCFLGLLVTLVASWELKWNGAARAADAREEGFGLCLRALGAERTSRYGRVRERDRCRHPGHVRAREAALRDVPLEADLRGLEQLGAVGAQGLESTPDFEEIRAGGLDEGGLARLWRLALLSE